MKNKQYYIKINGEDIPVSEEVYREYKRPLWTERKRNDRRSRCRDEKGRRCMKNCKLCEKQRSGGVLSLEKWIEDGFEVADPNDLIEQITDDLLIENLRKAVAELPENERLIIELAYSGKSEREAAAEAGLPRKTFVYRRDKIINKLKKIL